MEERSIFDEPQQHYQSQQSLANSTATLVLGILSIVMCFIGVVLGIIALVLANKDLKLYKANPEFYTIPSYNNLKAGRICAIIGLILQSLLILFYVIFFIFIFNMAGRGAWR